jgi:hypothetical protein
MPEFLSRQKESEEKLWNQINNKLKKDKLEKYRSLYVPYKFKKKVSKLNSIYIFIN